MNSSTKLQKAGLVHTMHMPVNKLEYYPNYIFIAILYYSIYNMGWAGIINI